MTADNLLWLAFAAISACVYWKITLAGAAVWVLLRWVVEPAVARSRHDDDG